MNTPPVKSWSRYRQSTRYLGAGSSTLSKRPRDEESEPALIARGQGCRIWDLDGNEYIDYRNALGPVTLGYCVPEIDQAIINQLKNGIIFGHPHLLEGEVAELLTEIIPCAEKVRFLKTGGEAVAACIKIARFATQRNTILHCGYNGWLNTLSPNPNLPPGMMGLLPENGVPGGLRVLHQTLPWGNAPPWQRLFAEKGSDIAAVVIACSYADMDKGRSFLPFIRNLTHRYGALMILDEIVTGFRLAMGGAHEYFHVQPDLAVFAKGMANGMPLAAYLGRADLINSSAEPLAISSTYGGETLSLAAAKAVIQFYRERQVIRHLWETGRVFLSGLQTLLHSRGLDSLIRVCGLEVCPAWVFNKPEIGCQFIRECYRHGVSLYHVSYISYAHKQQDVEETLERVQRALIACFEKAEPKETNR